MCIILPGGYIRRGALLGGLVEFWGHTRSAHEARGLSKLNGKHEIKVKRGPQKKRSGSDD